MGHNRNLSVPSYKMLYHSAGFWSLGMNAGGTPAGHVLLAAETTQANHVMSDKLLSPEAVAERLDISPVTVRHWVRADKLTGVKLHRVWRVKEADLQAFIGNLDAIQADPGALPV